MSGAENPLDLLSKEMLTTLARRRTIQGMAEFLLVIEDEIEQRYQQVFGVPFEELRKNLPAHPYTPHEKQMIKSIRSMLHRTVNPDTRKKITREGVVELYASGMTTENVAGVYGMTEHAFSVACRKVLGISGLKELKAEADILRIKGAACKKRSSNPSKLSGISSMVQAYKSVKGYRRSGGR